MALPIEPEQDPSDLAPDLTPHETGIAAIKAVILALDLDTSTATDQHEYEEGALILESLVTRLRDKAEDLTGRIAVSGIVDSSETITNVDIQPPDPADEVEALQEDDPQTAWLRALFKANPGRVLQRRDIYTAGYQKIAGNDERSPAALEQQFASRIKRLVEDDSSGVRMVDTGAGLARAYVKEGDAITSAGVEGTASAKESAHGHPVDGKSDTHGSPEAAFMLPFEVKVDRRSNFSVEVAGSPIAALEGLPALCLSLIIAASPRVSSSELTALLEVAGREVDEKRLMAALNRLKAGLDANDFARGLLTIDDSKDDRVYHLQDTHVKTPDDLRQYLSGLKFSPEEIDGLVHKLNYRGR